uniref:Nucleoside phosphorylase domain-containing protein n=1 Tax=Desulfobacca acetoxidans TaxID=60893 RepID=A0A7C3Z2A3_9BACT
MLRAPVVFALLAALSQEVRPFLRLVGGQRLPGIPLAAWEFACRAGRGVVVLSGLGGDAAARAAAWLLEQCRPQVLVSFGFGGAVTPGLAPGDLVLGEACWRYEPGQGTLRELLAPSPPWALHSLLDRLRAVGLPAFRGSVVTSPAIISKAAQGGPLLGLSHPVLDLETGAAALAAWDKGLPFLALRAVTDPASEEIPDFIAQAVRKRNELTAVDALAWLAADPRRLPALVRLWRRSRLASRRLARALGVVLNECRGEGGKRGDLPVLLPGKDMIRPD